MFTKKVKEPEYVKRMLAELKDLTEKIEKLEAFVQKDDFKKLNAYQRDLMIGQHGAMIAYRNLLHLRYTYEKQAVIVAAAQAKKGAK